MRIYNYVRPLWRNGAHIVHDVPERALTALKSHFAPGSIARIASDDVQIAHLDEEGLTVAWILFEVELPTRETGFSYRRARYLHVVVSPDPGWRDLDVHTARTLFSGVYGEDLKFGAAAGQVVLQKLTYPQDKEEALDLFVGRPRSAATASGPATPAAAAREPDPWRVIEPLPAQGPKTPPAPAPNVRPSWLAVGRSPSRRGSGFDPADASREPAPIPPPPTSLAGLLHGRLGPPLPGAEREGAGR